MRHHPRGQHDPPSGIVLHSFFTPLFRARIVVRVQVGVDVGFGSPVDVFSTHPSHLLRVHVVWFRSSSCLTFDQRTFAVFSHGFRMFGSAARPVVQVDGLAVVFQGVCPHAGVGCESHGLGRV